MKSPVFHFLTGVTLWSALLAMPLSAAADTFELHEVYYQHPGHNYFLVDPVKKELSIHLTVTNEEIEQHSKEPEPANGSRWLEINVTAAGKNLPSAYSKNATRNDNHALLTYTYSWPGSALEQVTAKIIGRDESVLRTETLGTLPPQHMALIKLNDKATFKALEHSVPIQDFEAEDLADGLMKEWLVNIQSAYQKSGPRPDDPPIKHFRADIKVGDTLFWDQVTIESNCYGDALTSTDVLFAATVIAPGMCEIRFPLPPVPEDSIIWINLQAPNGIFKRSFLYRYNKDRFTEERLARATALERMKASHKHQKAFTASRLAESASDTRLPRTEEAHLTTTLSIAAPGTSTHGLGNTGHTLSEMTQPKEQPDKLSPPRQEVTVHPLSGNTPEYSYFEYDNDRGSITVYTEVTGNELIQHGASKDFQGKTAYRLDLSIDVDGVTIHEGDGSGYMPAGPGPSSLTGQFDWDGPTPSEVTLSFHNSAGDAFRTEQISSKEMLRVMKITLHDQALFDAVSGTDISQLPNSSSQQKLLQTYQRMKERGQDRMLADVRYYLVNITAGDTRVENHAFTLGACYNEQVAKMMLTGAKNYVAPGSCDLEFQLPHLSDDTPITVELLYPDGSLAKTYDYHYTLDRYEHEKAERDAYVDQEFMKHLWGG